MRPYPLGVAVAAALAVTTLARPTIAQSLPEPARTFANPEPTARDYMSFWVSISGTLAAFGAPGRDENPGAVYVFRTNTGRLVGTFREPVESGGQFGWSVAVAGLTLVASAPWTDHVYVFDVQHPDAPPRALTPPEGGGAFGWATALSGSTLVVGSPFLDRAYVYNLASPGADPICTIQGPPGTFFGWAVAACGSDVMVGAPFGNAAYVYDALTGEQRGGALVDPASGPGDFLGAAVAIQGSTAVVGAPGNVFITPSFRIAGQPGRIIAYNLETGARRTMQASASADDLLGWSLGISGDLVVAGAPYADICDPLEKTCNDGAAYVFDLSSGELVARLKATQPGSTPDGACSPAQPPTLDADGFPVGPYAEAIAPCDDWFGRAVAIEGNRVVTGICTAVHVQSPPYDLRSDPGTAGVGFLFDVPRR